MMREITIRINLSDEEEEILRRGMNELWRFATVEDALEDLAVNALHNEIEIQNGLLDDPVIL